eukprot:s4331_g2.t1
MFGIKRERFRALPSVWVDPYSSDIKRRIHAGCEYCIYYKMFLAGRLRAGQLLGLALALRLRESERSELELEPPGRLMREIESLELAAVASGPRRRRSCRRPQTSGVAVPQAEDVWNDWVDWSVCQFTCGGGESIRTRKVRIMAQGHGKACDGNDRESRECTKNDCPVDCLWADWSKYSACSSTCGPGTRSRSRDFRKAAEFGGAQCVGNTTQTSDCNLGDCLSTASTRTGTNGAAAPSPAARGRESASEAWLSSLVPTAHHAKKLGRTWKRPAVGRTAAPWTASLRTEALQAYSVGLFRTCCAGLGLMGALRRELWHGCHPTHAISPGLCKLWWLGMREPVRKQDL